MHGLERVMHFADKRMVPVAKERGSVLECGAAAPLLGHRGSKGPECRGGGVREKRREGYRASRRTPKAGAPDAHLLVHLAPKAHDKLQKSARVRGAREILHAAWHLRMCTWQE